MTKEIFAADEQFTLLYTSYINIGCKLYCAFAKMFYFSLTQAECSHGLDRLVPIDK